MLRVEGGGTAGAWGAGASPLLGAPRSVGSSQHLRVTPLRPLHRWGDWVPSERGTPSTGPGKDHGSSSSWLPGVGRGRRKHTGPPSPQVIYLRRFKALRTLSLSGNPVAEDEDYKMFICAYLPDLVYLDFRRLDDHMVASPFNVGSVGQRPGPGHLGRATSTGGEESSPSWRLLTLTAPVTVVHVLGWALTWASSRLLAAVLLCLLLRGQVWETE